MNLKEKLKRLDPLEKENKSVSRSHTQGGDIAGCLGGELKERAGGLFFKKQQKYDPEFQHGSYPLRKIKDIDGENLALIFNQEFKRVFDYRNFLFIDTETTGLAGGTGTVPFMIGLGYFKEEQFFVDQLLMRDFDEELPLLEELGNMINEDTILVSFNGKCFDLPLIKTRYILNRCGKLDFSCHFDLLHASRRIWSHLDSCSLNSLELNILDVVRKDDLPGSEVPALYFDFLKSRNPHLLKPIFKHNLIDIISLVALLNHLFVVYDNQAEIELDCRELFNLGKIYEKKKLYSRSAFYLHKAAQRAKTDYLKTKIKQKLSWQYKRMDKWEQAHEIWVNLVKKDRGGLSPLVELAKYFEHQKKEYLPAIRYTEKALTQLKEKRSIINNYQQKEEKLQHRLNRLQQKVKKQGG